MAKVWHVYFTTSEVRCVLNFKNAKTMSRPKNPTGKKKGSQDQLSSHGRRHENEEFERTIPGRRTPEYEKQQSRVLNEDEQNKIVNRREDNAQTHGEPASNDVDSYDLPNENQNDRLEAGDDNSEVNPRPRKVN